jgi:hypothetical protein
MGDWLSYLRLTAKARTGVSGNVVVSGVVVVWAALATLLWLSITLFAWIARRYDDPVLAGLVLSGIYFCIALIFGIAIVIARRLARQKAEAVLAARKSPLFDSSMIAVGFQIGQAIGWRRLVSLAGVALLASGLAKEWLAHREPPPEQDQN